MSTPVNLEKDSKTEDAEAQLTDGDSTSLQQDVEDIRDRLITLSDKINLCQSVLNDLKDLSDMLVRKCPDASLQPQK